MCKLIPVLESESVSCSVFVAPWTVGCQAPLSMTFSRQKYWSGFPFPSPRDLPDPGIETRSPAFQAGSLPSETVLKGLSWTHQSQGQCIEEHPVGDFNTLRYSINGSSRQKSDKKTLILWNLLSRVWLCNPMNCSLPVSYVHGILQARILLWVAYPFSSGSSQPRHQTGFSCMQADSLPAELPGKLIGLEKHIK